MGKFEELYGLNVNEKVEKKNGQTYLSWAWAWAEFKKQYPNATYKIERFDGLYCTGSEKHGYMVETSVTADDLTYCMWLPVMDLKNKSILQPTTFDINKAIMRCLTKNLAMFGLGLYIYAGDDLPESEAEEHPAKPAKPVQNKPLNEPKTDDKKGFKPLTKTEMVSVYGIKNVAETIVWFEGKFGCEMANWDEELTEIARAKLQEKKDKREAEERRKSGLERVSNDDIPFPLGD